MKRDPGPTEAAQPPPTRRGRRIVLLIAVAGALVAFRYLPALDEARALRTDLETMVGRVQEAGLAIDPANMDALDADLASARGGLADLRSLLANDPLIGLARAMPLTAANVRAADSVVAAASALLDGVGEGLTLGRRFVEIREAQAADPKGASALSQLVELMATSGTGAVSAAASIASARQMLATVPDGLISQVESVRDAMQTRIEKYGPLLDTYVDVSARLPAILGWDGPRRYLVLTQDPSELRPGGGFIGSFGIIAFDRGRITSATSRTSSRWTSHGTTRASSHPRSWRTISWARSSHGSSPTPTGRPTFQRALRTRSACTRTNRATHVSTGSSG